MISEKAKRTRESIIAAAREVIRRDGVDALTMDRAAKEAGLSKGACMYHFKNKRELYAALIADYAQHLEAEQRRHEALFKGRPDETLVPGFIEWFKSFEKDSRAWADVGVALLSQFVHDEELMAPVYEWYERLFHRIDALPEEERVPAFVAVMALEGFFYTRKFGVNPKRSALNEAAWQFIMTDLVKNKVERR